MSQQNESPWCAFVAATPRSESMTRPAHEGPVHPFCGAEMSASTPFCSMSTHTVPEAMQSRTKMPPYECTASETVLM